MSEIKTLNVNLSQSFSTTEKAQGQSNLGLTNLCKQYSNKGVLSSTTDTLNAGWFNFQAITIGSSCVLLLSCLKYGDTSSSSVRYDRKLCSGSSCDSANLFKTLNVSDSTSVETLSISSLSSLEIGISGVDDSTWQRAFVTVSPYESYVVIHIQVISNN